MDCLRSLVGIVVFIYAALHVPFAKNTLSSKQEAWNPLKVGSNHQLLQLHTLLPCPNDLQYFADSGESCVFKNTAALYKNQSTAFTCFAHSIVYGLLMTVQCHWLYSCLYRNKLRKNFGLAEEPCCDCLVNYCCEPCALCQEHAELKSRGFNPSIGWIGPPTSPPDMPPSMFK
ncbi:hypothetical protein ACLB2K_040813 [Fragaria x ananassa]